MILLCQTKVKSDAVITAKEMKVSSQVAIKMLPCRVTKMQLLSDDVMQLFLQLPKSQKFNFLNGQYIDLLLKDGQKRSFSIANIALEAEKEGLELHIRKVDGGQFTPKVFSSMREKDLLRLEGPYGTYLLQSEPEQPMIMVAGGTGFAPIKALLIEAFDKNPDWKIHLFWGVRDSKDIYMSELLEQWSHQYKNFTFTAVLSEPKDMQWQGETGFVDKSVAHHYPSLLNHDVYASGPPVMINALKTRLSSHGLDLNRFYYDSFDFTPIT